MKTHLVQPVGKNTPSPRLAGDTMKDQPARQQAPEQGKAAQSAGVDEVRLSQLVEEALEKQGKGDEAQKPLEELNRELEQLMLLVEESNRKIETAAKLWEKLKPKPVPAPSALGLTVSGAAGKLKQSELRVTCVRREYSGTVKAGHVVAQIPAPGGNATKERGVTLIVSKGPPPEEEKHDLKKRQESTPAPKAEAEANGDSTGDYDGSIMDFDGSAIR